MKKKILFVITKSNWGGAQRYVFDMATHLPKDQFEVCVALGGTGNTGASMGLLGKKLQDAGIRILFLESFVRDISLAQDMRIGFELLRLFKNEKPDIVHLNSSKAVVGGALAARLSRVPKIIATIHGWAFNEPRPFWQKWIFSLGHWFGILWSHYTICISNYDAGLVRGWPFIQKKVRVIYNGIDLNMTFGRADMVRQSFPKGVRITGTIGELTKNKNQISLVEQARENQTMHVAIVGDGELRSYLQKKVEEYDLTSRVKIMGFHWASEVLHGFDVFALPSLKEGLPYVLLEAKCAGLPIVANRVGGVGEILDAQDMSEFTLKKMVEKTQELYLS